MTTDNDEQAFLREIEHAQLMRRQQYKQECNRRFKKMEFNERQASFALEQSAAQTKQEGLKAVNHQTIDDEGNRKQSVNMQFWHSIKQVVFVIACAAIAIYTLIHFA